MKLSPEFQIDGYKLDHRRQYPENTEFVQSNWTPRGSRIDGVTDVILSGLQYFLEEYLVRQWNENFFSVPANIVAEKYERRVNGYLGPNSVGVQHILDLHKLGYLPLEFRAIPEGSSVPLRVPMIIVENTHKDFGWLTNYMETIMSSVMWMPCTSATIAKRMKNLLVKRAVESGGNLDFVNWQGHDFSMRGMPGLEAAALSGMGHLISFTGTDTIPAIEIIEQYYGCAGLIGGSVSATEHSTVCAGGEDNELETVRRLLKIYEGVILSYVADSWDYFGLLTKILPQLKPEIMARDGKLVIRPDSGDPVKIVCGDYGATPFSVESKGSIQILWDLFGGTVNAAGYKELDPHIGLIYGDSINYDRADQITAGLMKRGFASTNIVFGMGSYGYQFNTRDTFGFAMKATWCQINGVGKSIFKKPKTDDGTKNSAKGRLAVVKDQQTGKLVCLNEATPEQEAQSVLKPVWRNGKFLKKYTFDEVRANAA